MTTIKEALEGLTAAAAPVSSAEFDRLAMAIKFLAQRIDEVDARLARLEGGQEAPSNG